MKNIIMLVATLCLCTTLGGSRSVYAEDSIEYAVKPNRELTNIQHNQLDTLFLSLRHC